MNVPFLSAYQSLLNLLSPPACLYCAALLQTRHALCARCAENIQPIVSEPVIITPKMNMNVCAVGAYADPLRRLILAKHYSSRAVSKQLGELLWHSSVHEKSFDFIIPVPLHWTRYARRGYNQATVMAEELARLSGKPMADIVHRTRVTHFQAGLSSERRRTNVQHAFVARADDMFIGKRLLLVDDLMTTGATLREVGKALMPLKPSSLEAVVVCRVI